MPSNRASVSASNRPKDLKLFGTSDRNMRCTPWHPTTNSNVPKMSHDDEFFGQVAWHCINSSLQTNKNWNFITWGYHMQDYLADFWCALINTSWRDRFGRSKPGQKPRLLTFTSYTSTAELPSKGLDYIWPILSMVTFSDAGTPIHRGKRHQLLRLMCGQCAVCCGEREDLATLPQVSVCVYNVYRYPPDPRHLHMSR